MKKETLIRRDCVQLTPAEIGVAREVTLGKCNKQIAYIRNIKVDTVAKHIQSACEKLHVSNRVGLAEFMLEFGYVTWDQIHAAYDVRWRI